MMMYVLLAAVFLGTLVDDSTQLSISRRYHGYGYYWPWWTTPTLRNIKKDDAFYRYLEAVSREAITNLRKARLTSVQSTYAHRYTVSGDANDANIHFYSLRPKNVRYRYRSSSRRYYYSRRGTYRRYKRDVSDDGHRAKRNIFRTWRNFRKANYRTYKYRKFRKNYWRKGYRTRWYRKQRWYGRRKWYRKQHRYGRRTRHSRYSTRRTWISSAGGTLVTTGVVGRYYVTLSTSKYSTKLTFMPLRYYRGWFSDTVGSRIYTYSKRTSVWSLLRPRYRTYNRLRYRKYKPRRKFLGKVRKAFRKFKKGRKFRRLRRYRKYMRKYRKGSRKLRRRRRYRKYMRKYRKGSRKLRRSLRRKFGRRNRKRRGKKNSRRHRRRRRRRGNNRRRHRKRKGRRKHRRRHRRGGRKHKRRYRTGKYRKYYRYQYI